MKYYTLVLMYNTYTKMIQIIYKLFIRISSVERKIQLGRWNVENCDKILNRKIYLANRDHSVPYDNYFRSKNINNLDTLNLDFNKK